MSLSIQNSSPGAWQVNKRSGSFPIYSTLCLNDFGLDTVGDGYMVMPGYSLYVGFGTASNHTELISVKNETNAYIYKECPPCADNIIILWYNNTIVPQVVLNEKNTIENIPPEPTN
jgi:hypothetical protein